MTIYYIALLVVQSILMGATIDYAILFTNYYREIRMTKMAEEALTEAYSRSIHTILTSGSIVVSVTAIVGYAFEDPSVRQIVHTISKGAACAVLLILFVLPGLLAALDRITAGQGALTQTGVKGGRHSDTD
jgi:predicted RND superfamily exporter protein